MMVALVEQRFERLTDAYKRLLDAYIYGNRYDRERLIAEGEFLIADAEWGFAPPVRRE